MPVQDPQIIRPTPVPYQGGDKNYSGVTELVKNLQAISKRRAEQDRYNQVMKVRQDAEARALQQQRLNEEYRTAGLEQNAKTYDQSILAYKTRQKRLDAELKLGAEKRQREADDLAYTRGREKDEDTREAEALRHARAIELHGLQVADAAGRPAATKPSGVPDDPSTPEDESITIVPRTSAMGFELLDRDQINLNKRAAADASRTSNLESITGQYGAMGSFDPSNGEYTWENGNSGNVFDKVDPRLENALAFATQADDAKGRENTGRHAARMLQPDENGNVSPEQIEMAKDFMRTGVLAASVVDARDIRSKTETIELLINAGEILNRLKDAGIPTGIVEGSTEKLLRYIGKTKHPEWVELGVSLKQALQAYRLAMTGVQFSEKESQQYDRLFPNFQNTHHVNMALIRGMTSAFETRINTFWRQKMGNEANARYINAWVDVPNFQIGGDPNRGPNASAESKEPNIEEEWVTKHGTFVHDGTGWIRTQ